MRPLVESAFRNVGHEELADIRTAIESATNELTGFGTVESLENNIRTLFESMSGPNQNIAPTLGIGATDERKLMRNIRLLIDDGRRGINDASLGSDNIVCNYPPLLIADGVGQSGVDGQARVARITS